MRKSLGVTVVTAIAVIVLAGVGITTIAPLTRGWIAAQEARANETAATRALAEASAYAVRTDAQQSWMPWLFGGGVLLFVVVAAGSLIVVQSAHIRNQEQLLRALHTNTYDPTAKMLVALNRELNAPQPRRELMTADEARRQFAHFEQIVEGK